MHRVEMVLVEVERNQNIESRCEWLTGCYMVILCVLE